MRTFTFGFVRQLDAVAARLLTKAWAAGAGPDDTDMVIDLDFTIGEVHGPAKQGAGGVNRFADELAGVLCRAKATGAKCVRADSGF